MAREGLLVELRNALTRVKKDNAAVEKRNLRLKNGNGNGENPETTESTRLVNFEIVPITLGNMKELYYMIVFQEAPIELARGPAPRRTRPSEQTESALRRTAKLEEELAATKEYLQSVIETQEATNEDSQRMRRYFQTARNCKAQTKKWIQPRKSCNPPTRNSQRLTMTFEAAIISKKNFLTCQHALSSW